MYELDESIKQRVMEMDKSQTPPGRDGSNSDSDAGKKEYTAKTITPKKAVKHAEKILNKELTKKQGVSEMRDRRDAYQRDYDSSQTGFGRQHREIDDEANLMYVYDDGVGRVKQRMISNHEERSAHQEGFRQTPEDALRIHGIIRSKFDPKKWVQKEGTKWIQVYPFGQQSVAEEEEDKMDRRFRKTEWMPLMDAIKILKHYGATPEKYMGHDMFPYYDIEGNRKYLEDITWNADNSKNVRISLVNQAVRELKAQKQDVAESATAGATSAASIGTVDAPHISPGKARGKKNYTGSPGSGSGTKAPPQPKVVQPKNKDGTAKNGLDIKGTSLFGGPANEAAVIKRR